MVTLNTGIGAITLATLSAMRCKLEEAAAVARAAETLTADGQPGRAGDDGAGCRAADRATTRAAWKRMRSALISCRMAQLNTGGAELDRLVGLGAFVVTVEMRGGDRGVQPVRTRPKDDQSSLSVSISRARVPSSELPLSFSPGDHTAIEAVLGAIARMPPPTPLLAGRPTR